MPRSRLLLLVLAGLGLVVGLLAWLASEEREADVRAPIDGSSAARSQPRVSEEAAELEPVTNVLPGTTAPTSSPTREPVRSNGAQLSGHVRDERGIALAQAFVGERSAGILGGDGEVTLSDDSGAFELTGIAPGPVTLVARADGHEMAMLDVGTVSEGERREGIDFVLGRGSSVAGRVRWPDGTPAVDAEVAMADEIGERPRHYRTAQGRTDSEGRFELLRLTSGPFRVEAQVRRDVEVLVRSFGVGEERPKMERTTYFASARHVSADARDLDLVLTRGTPVRGSVRDDLGELLEDFRITARSAAAMLLAPEKVVESFYESSGVFELLGLAEGAWTLEVRALGHASATVEIDTTNGAALEIVLPRNASVAGKILDSVGQPASGATLHAVYVSDGEQTWKGEARSLRSGRFLLPSVPPGEVRLTATLPGAAASEGLVIALEPAEKVDDLVMSLRRPGRIAGVVRAPPGTVMRDVELQGEGESRTEALGDGGFAFEDLAPGKFTLRCADRSDSVSCSVEVELAEGETRHVVLDPEAP